MCLLQSDPRHTRTKGRNVTLANFRKDSAEIKRRIAVDETGGVHFAWVHNYDQIYHYHLPPE